MHKQTLLEWQYPEEPGAMDSLTGLSIVPTARKRLPRRIVWSGVVALLVLLAAAGARLWHTAHAGLAAIETEIDAAVNADVWNEGQGVADVQLVNLANDVAVVEVDLPAAVGMPLLHQTRVYRQTETGWTRTAPSAALWGRPRRLETTHFVFAYYERDEAAVQASAAHLDRLYPSLYAACFAGTPPADKRVIQVDPAHTPGDYTPWMKHQDPLVVASPAAYLAPGDVTPEALLTQSIVLLLLDEFEYQLAMQYAKQPYWQDHGDSTPPLWPIVDGVSVWQLWANDLPLAQWRKPVVQWVFANAHDASNQSPIHPAFKPELCAMHDLWMDSPIYLQLPFPCDERFEKSDVMYKWLRSGLPRGEAPLLLTQRYILSSDGMHPTRNVALATAMEYAAATYGPERIPVLLATMGRHSRWETLVVEVFGVSAEEFEAGWTVYLAEHYGVEIQITD